MRYTTSCPECQHAITLWRVFWAPTPWHLKCPECRSGVRLKSSPWIGLVAALAVGLLVGVPLGILEAFGIVSWFGALAIAAAAAALFDFFASLVVVNVGVFRAKKPA